MFALHRQTYMYSVWEHWSTEAKLIKEQLKKLRFPEAPKMVLLVYICICKIQKDKIYL